MLKLKLFFGTIFLCYCLSPKSAADFYSKFHQHDCKIDLQRMEVVKTDKSLVNFFKINTFKYNRTFTAVNATCNLKKNMSTELEMLVQVYKFLSNEYRIFPGIRFQVNFCRSIKENIVGLQLLHKCGNFSSCQIIEETTYHTCNFYLDELRFPPLLPNGEFKLQIEFLYKGKSAATFFALIRVYRPISVPARKHKSVY